MLKTTGMKKFLGFFLCFFVLITIAAGQATQASITYNKMSEPVLMLELPYNESVSENFIIENLKKTGYDVETKGKLFWKQNKLHGFYTFKDVRLEGAVEKVDLYFKVENKSRRDKEESVIYMLVSKGDENFISSTSDEYTYNAAKNFLNGFVEQSAVYKLDLDIKNQEDAVNNAQKKLDKLKDNEKDMEKKMEQLDKDLKKNREDQKDQEKAIETERKKLEDLKIKKS
jgi:hypothetical protein